jgi:hypothetical protein
VRKTEKNKRGGESSEHRYTEIEDALFLFSIAFFLLFITEETERGRREQQHVTKRKRARCSRCPSK